MMQKFYRILAVPLFTDNYSYIVDGFQRQKLLLVDPAQPKIIIDFIKNHYPNNYTVSHVLYTHKHWDHAGGAQQLADQIKEHKAEIISGAQDGKQIGTVNVALEKDGSYGIGERVMKYYSVPCHTRGHIIYHLTPGQKQYQLCPLAQEMHTDQNRKVYQFMSNQCSFTGDTLFSGGIGRFFQGNAEQMVENIAKIVKNIPQDCDIFNGHQYTKANLEWSTKVESSNTKMSNYLLEIKEREKKQFPVCTLPTSIARQVQINAFLRVITGTPFHETITKDKVKLMTILRTMKNNNSTVFEKMNL